MGHTLPPPPQPKPQFVEQCDACDQTGLVLPGGYLREEARPKGPQPRRLCRLCEGRTLPIRVPVAGSFCQLPAAAEKDQSYSIRNDGETAVTIMARDRQIDGMRSLVLSPGDYALLQYDDQAEEWKSQQNLGQRVRGVRKRVAAVRARLDGTMPIAQVARELNEVQQELLARWETVDTWKEPHEVDTATLATFQALQERLQALSQILSDHWKRSLQQHLKEAIIAGVVTVPEAQEILDLEGLKGDKLCNELND